VKRVIFIGRPKATEDEARLLAILGAAFALDDTQVVTSPKGECNAAVTAGQREHGMSPTLIAGPDLVTTPADGTLVYADAALLAQLDERVPAWRQRGPVIIENDLELYEYVMVAAAAHFQARAAA
jgi:hypothetical protein